MRAGVLLFALMGCLEADVVECPGGTTCPAGSTCDEIRGGCLTDEQIRACEGLDNGTSCTIELPDDGVCDQSVCVFATCGDNYRRPSEACDGALFADINNCTQLGFYDDVPLSCTDQCELDQTVCTGFCGDGLVDPAHELCDGTRPASSCVEFGFGTGVLECSSGCGPQFDDCVPFGFTRIDMPKAVSHIHGTSATNIWVVGAAGMVQRFDGTSWTAVDVSGCTSSEVSRVFVLSPTEAFIVLASGGVGLVTASGCARYTLDTDVRTVWAASITDAYVGGSAGVWHLEQGTWVNVDTGLTDILWGSGPADVYAGAESGELRHYNGLTWSAPAAVGGMNILFGIWGDGADEVYLSGADATGAVIKRKDGAGWIDVLAQSPMIGGTSFATFGGVASGRNYVLVADFTNAPTGVLITGSDGHWVNLGASGELGQPLVTSDGAVYLRPAATAKFVLQFTGTALVTTPQPPRQATSLTAVHEDEAYAVTPRFFNDGDLWAWDGATWTQEQTSNSHEVLAVGGEVFAIIASRLQRRTGPSTWTELSFASATELAGSSPTDLWVGGGSSQLRHWTGSTLTGYASPLTATYDIWAASPTFAVAVGRIDTPSVVGAIAHWNGSAWSPVALPAGTGTVTHVWGRGPSEVYAVAASPVSQSDVLLRFDGISWAAFPIQPPDSQIVGLWGTGPSDLFAATNRGLLRFDGMRWSPVDAGTTQSITSLASAGNTLYIGASDALNQIVRVRPW